MLRYTVLAVASVVAVVTLEVVWLRTGLLRRASFWITCAICAFFQVLVDGWLTKLSSPIVRYDEAEMTGWRVPFDIPVEDYLFGFTLLTLTLLLWERTRLATPASVRSELP